MIDSVVQNIKKNIDSKTELHPQIPKFSGSINYQQGTSRTFFITTGRKFIPVDNPKKPDQNGFMLKYGCAFTIAWIWINNKWTLNVNIENREPCCKRKIWEDYHRSNL